VVTLKKGLNDGEIGRIIDYALGQPCVRGVTFQPVQAAGRLDGFDPATDRLTLTEVRRRILEQSTVFRPEDIIPVPCHPDALAMAYALKIGGRVVPLTGMIDPQVLVQAGRNTIVYEHDDQLRGKIFTLFATNHSPASGAQSLHDLLCCLPQVEVRLQADGTHITADPAATPGGLSYQNVFRVIIMQFMDAAGFDVRSVKKSCVHIVHPIDGRLIPFDTYNLFYRDGLESSHLAPLRATARARSPETRP
jgi:uncharacterized radical SAM superfamily Fe-S cluster-containing enzyme